jgi:hypothetical protein
LSRLCEFGDGSQPEREFCNCPMKSFGERYINSSYFIVLHNQTTTTTPLATMDYKHTNTDIAYNEGTNQERVFTIYGSDTARDHLEGIQFINEDHEDCCICSEAFEWKPNPGNWAENGNEWETLPVKPLCHCKNPICYKCLYSWLNTEKEVTIRNEEGEPIGFDYVQGIFTCPTCRAEVNQGIFLLSEQDFMEEYPEVMDIETDDEEFPEEDIFEMPNGASLEEHQAVIADLLERLMRKNTRIAALKKKTRDSEKARKAVVTTNRKLREQLAGKQPPKKKAPTKRRRQEGSGIRIEPARKEAKKEEEPIDIDDSE